MKQLIWFLLTFLLPFSPLAGEKTVRIAFTTDIHGAIFPVDHLNNRVNAPSMASLQTWLDSARAVGPKNLILLDNGDLIQGTPAAYFANFVQKKPSNLFSRILNHLKFDAATVGNHDIEGGPEVYYRLQQEFRFPYLGGNVVRTADGAPAFSPYTVIERDGIRVAVLGLTTPGIPNWLPAILWPGLEFQPLVESAIHWTSYIKLHEKPDVLIALLHTGMGSQEYPPSVSIIENAGQIIAREVTGIDLVLLGHDHRQRSETVINRDGKGIPVLNPGSGLQRIGYAEMVFDSDTEQGYSLKNIHARLIDLVNVQPSASYLRTFKSDIKATDRYATRRIAKLTERLDASEVLYGSAAFTDLIHDFQLKHTGADISFTAPLSTTGSLEAGWMTTTDMFRLYRYENYLYLMELSGKEVKDYLEFSYALWFNTMQSPGDYLLNFRKDASGSEIVNANGRLALANPSFNFDSAAGLRYTVDVSKPAGNRITIETFENGAPFAEDATYKVAINSYRGSGGGGHLTTGAGISHQSLSGRIVYTSERDIRSQLMDYLQKRGTLTPESRGNWKTIPGSWAESGRANDQKMGF